MYIQQLWHCRESWSCREAPLGLWAMILATRFILATQMTKCIEMSFFPGDQWDLEIDLIWSRFKYLAQWVWSTSTTKPLAGMEQFARVSSHLVFVVLVCLGFCNGARQTAHRHIITKKCFRPEIQAIGWSGNIHVDCGMYLIYSNTPSLAQDLCVPASASGR